MVHYIFPVPIGEYNLNNHPDLKKLLDIINLPRLNVVEGNLVNIPVKVYTNEDLGSLQLAMKYDKDLLEFKGLYTDEKPMAWLSFLNANDGVVEWGGIDMSANKFNLKNNEQVVTLQFLAKKPKEQKAIVSILSTMDEKIDLLQAQNKTLETMAQTIFKEWFGKYQQESTPPKGWRTFSLSELVDTINGYSYKGKELVEESNEALVSLKSFDRNGGFQTRGFKPFKGSPKTQHEVKIGDLVVAHTDLTQDAEVLGNPAFIFDNGGFEKMYITMDLVKVISKNENIGSSFLYYLMKDRYFKGHCVGYSNGTTVLHLSKKAIPEYQLYLPENFDLIKKFTKIANDTTNKISLNKDAIKSLTKTRDTLLPKLMSGQVRVNNRKNA